MPLLIHAQWIKNPCPQRTCIGMCAVALLIVKVETIQMSTHRCWTNNMYKFKWNKREQSPATMWMSLESITLSEGSRCGHGLGEFVYSEYPEQANSQRQKVD